MSNPEVTIGSAYDPTLYHAHPMTAILYAKNSGFTVDDEKFPSEVFAFREDVQDRFLLKKIDEEKWCWTRMR